MKRKACAECKHNCKRDLERVCLKCLGDGGQEFEEKERETARLIDANSITEAMIVKYLGPGYASCAPDVLDLIGDQPTIEVEPVVHSKWYYDRFGVWHCENCDCGPLCDGREIVLSKRCPHCGAYMDGGGTRK